MGENLNNKVANAVGGRTARACDSCLRRRARWFCPADDAFLCQSCDASVHGVNQLAGRHQRVRLQTASFKGEEEPTPAWHRGFTRKARTPRRRQQLQQQHQQQQLESKNYFDGDEMALESFFVDPPLPFVPEMSSEEEKSPGAGEIGELLYQVPVFEPSLRKLGQQHHHDHDDQILGFLDSELDLAEFAADVESLLGVEDMSYRLDDVMGCKEEEREDFDVGIDVDFDFEPRVKVEEDDQPVLGFQQNPNPLSSVDDDCGNNLSPEMPNNKTNILLTLNYEAVITAWDEQGSPWMTGIRPNVKPEHAWLDCLEMGPADFRRTNGDWPGLVRSGSGHNSGEGREARVSRYREKRRTRLFSKKIRYEVRKLNAEKRPRMKGRFVKRSTTSFMGPNNNNNNNNPSTMIASTTFPYHFMNK